MHFRQYPKLLWTYLFLLSALFNAQTWASNPCLDPLEKLRVAQSLNEKPQGPTVFLRPSLPPNDAVKELNQLTTLTLASYNVLNLVMHRGKFIAGPTGQRIQVSPTVEKPIGQLKGVADSILKTNPDVMVLEEVDSIDALNFLNREFLKNRYDVVLIEGNDSRGIDVGFLIRKGLPFYVEIQSHKNVSVGGGTSGTPVFSRDFPVLVFRATPTGDPLFIFAGTHFKSQRDSLGDPRSERVRRVQVLEALRIMKFYMGKYGSKTPFLIAGDFNANLLADSEFQPLWDAGMKDVFDLTPKPLSASERVTHTFHPHGGAPHYSQMDGILVSATASRTGLIQSAAVIPYFDPSGKIKPLPVTYAERDQNPSDHFMISATLNFANIFNAPNAPAVIK